MTDLNVPNHTSFLELLDFESETPTPKAGAASAAPTYVATFSANTDDFEQARIAIGARYKGLGISLRFENVTLDPVRTSGDLIIFRSVISDAGQEYEPANTSDIKIIKDDFLGKTPRKNRNDKTLLLAAAKIEIDGEAIRFYRSEEAEAPKTPSTKQQLHNRIVESQEPEVIIHGLLKAINLSGGAFSLGKVIVQTMIGNEQVHYGNIENISIPKCIEEILQRVGKKEKQATVVATHDGSLVEITKDSALEILEKLANSLLAEISEIRKNSSK